MQVLAHLLNFFSPNALDAITQFPTRFALYDGPLLLVWDACYENGDMPAIAAFVPGNDAIGFGTKTEEERKTVVLQSLVCALYEYICSLSLS